MFKTSSYRLGNGQHWLDQVLDLNNGDLAQAVLLAAEKALISYREERLENERRLNHAGVGYDLIVNHMPSEIETKFRGQPTIIQELKKMQNSVEINR